MKLFFSFIFCVITGGLLFSCSNHSAAASTDTKITATGTQASPAGGDARFSYHIEGRSISGSGTEPGVNAARHTSDGRLRFVLMSLDPNEKAPPQFDFAVNDHGATTTTADDMDKHRSGDGKIFADFSIPPLQTTDPLPKYEFANHIEVNILSISDSRVKGSFSGDLLNPLNKKIVALRDGVFDLPVVAGK